MQNICIIPNFTFEWAAFYFLKFTFVNFHGNIIVNRMLSLMNIFFTYC